MKYIKGLDTLRAFAVTVVLLGHWGLPEHLGTMGARLFNGLVPNPKFGVDLFFVLSGFLITSILMNANEGGEKKMSILGNFIARRTLRIFPIYYLAILALVLLGNPFVRENLSWFLTYTANFLFYRQQDWNYFGHTWSLSVEEQFYLVWPWLIVFTPRRYLKYILYLSIFIGLATTLYIAKIRTPVNMFGLLLTPTCMQAFGIGGLYAYCSRKDDERKLFIKGINILLPFALLCHFYWSFSMDGGHFNYWYRAVDSILSIWLIHYTITARPGWVKRNLLENGILVKIGRVSYGIYLYHYDFPWVFSKVATADFFKQHYVITFSIQLTLLLLLCVLSFECIEKPVLKLKRLFQYRHDKGAPPRAAPEILPGLVTVGD
jgi:peptidoglycan/LPS O-acetylase OafA/YrhL